MQLINGCRCMTYRLIVQIVVLQMKNTQNPDKQRERVGGRGGGVRTHKYI